MNRHEESAVERSRKRWDTIHSHHERDKIKQDDWLESFQEVIYNCQTPIMDLGCGSGNDTLYLVNKGKKVIPCDYSQNAIQNIYKNFPEVEQAECFDMTRGLPFADHFTDIIISDLSLHYFSEQETFKILREIKRVLKPQGIFLFRVNSVKDKLHGAGEGREIEPHLYETGDGRYKRFFDKKDFEKFFFDWETICLQEETMYRYELPKVLWKAAMRGKASIHDPVQKK